LISLKDVMKRIERQYPAIRSPFLSSQKYGLIVGPERTSLQSQIPVKGIAVTNDLTARVIKEADNRSANLIITLHDFLDNTGTIDDRLFGRLKMLLDRRIYVYKLHESIGIARNGICDAIAEKLRLKNCDFVRMEYKLNKIPILLVCEHEKIITVRELVRDVTRQFNIPAIKYSGEGTKIVKRIGIFVGNLNKKKIIDIAKQNDIDVILLGETTYNVARYALDNRISIIEMTRYLQEVEGLKRISKIIQVNIPEVNVFFITSENVFQIFIY